MGKPLCGYPYTDNPKSKKQEVNFMATIHEKMTIHEVLTLCPNIAPVFHGFGMHCLGCPMSRGETVAQAARAHGVDPAEMLNKLNEFADGQK
jgi:hybrid cluster-associated redox disulfide protein